MRPRCDIHKCELLCPGCIAELARGKTSEAKKLASRANGKLGGRPRKTPKQV